MNIVVLAKKAEAGRDVRKLKQRMARDGSIYIEPAYSPGKRI